MVEAQALKKDIIAKYKMHDTDTGSSEVQIALLTSRIKYLTEHFKIHKKDFHGRRGLLRLVARRRRLLDYLKRNDLNKYKGLLVEHGIRK
ncbi:MAG: 30S ribosomal protein S15 [Deltaproteobacteria bacterium RIFOXYA12_FULL_61_11]|nr:MAG: 30S ribosomal protein S15 [Deltaproteobacteria bacterium RIFOXYA12_FULL_61_11]